MCQAVMLVTAMTLCEQDAKVTFYTPNEGWGCGCRTASGLSVRRGYAAHPTLPFGTRFILWGEEYEVQDRGGGLRGNHFDIFFWDVPSGYAWLRAHSGEPRVVYLIEEAVEGDYVVRPGDTLSGIAARSGTTVDALVEANGIENQNLIHAGQALAIP